MGGMLSRSVPVSDRLKRVLQVWQDMPRVSDIPRRSDLSPHDLPPGDLAYVALLDVLDGGADFRYRLVGTGLVDSVGEEFTGVLISDHLHRAEVPEMLKDYCRSVTERRYTVFEGSLTRLDKEFIVYERLSLPLLDEGDTVCQVLAAFDFRNSTLDGLPGLRALPIGG